MATMKYPRDCAYCGDEAVTYIPDMGDVCAACFVSNVEEELDRVGHENNHECERSTD